MPFRWRASGRDGSEADTGTGKRVAGRREKTADEKREARKSIFWGLFSLAATIVAIFALDAVFSPGSGGGSYQSDGDRDYGPQRGRG